MLRLTANLLVCGQDLEVGYWKGGRSCIPSLIAARHSGRFLQAQSEKRWFCPKIAFFRHQLYHTVTSRHISAPRSFMVCRYHVNRATKWHKIEDEISFRLPRTSVRKLVRPIISRLLCATRCTYTIAACSYLRWCAADTCMHVM